MRLEVKVQALTDALPRLALYLDSPCWLIKPFISDHQVPHRMHTRNHIQHRCHSNLKQMDDDTLARLIALIPSDLTTLDIRLDVFEFVPSPKRDSMVQLQR